MGLIELKALKKLNHENIIQLKEVIKVNNELYFIFDYLGQNLYQEYKARKRSGIKYTEAEIKNIIYQICKGLAYMHHHGYFHRDIKPENILIDGSEVKIADFGLARQVRSRPPFTDYVSTRWYRAPELLLKAPNYNSPVDIFALGLIMAELYLLNPLFPGESEIDQIYKICAVLGTPPQNWSEGYRLANQCGYSFPSFGHCTLGNVVRKASDSALNIMRLMLEYDPNKRITAEQVLRHPFFADQRKQQTRITRQRQHNNDRKIQMSEVSSSYSRQNDVSRNSIVTPIHPYRPEYYPRNNENNYNMAYQQKKQPRETNNI